MPKAEGAITFTPVGWDELADKYRGSREVILRGMNTAFRRMGKHMVTELKAYTPVGVTHNLRNKTVAEVLGTAEDMRLEIRQSAWSGSYPYGVGVRMSTRPHWPPYRALIPWVKLRWGLSDELAPRAAFLLARRISRVGTKANPYHVRALEANKEALREIVIEEVEKAIKLIGQAA